MTEGKPGSSGAKACALFPLPLHSAGGVTRWRHEDLPRPRPVPGPECSRRCFPLALGIPSPLCRSRCLP